MTLLTPIEAAEHLGVCEKTLRSYRTRGLRYVQLSARCVRYKPEDLEDFINDRCLTDQKTARTGTSISKSKVVDFAEAVGQVTSKKQSKSRPKRE